MIVKQEFALIVVVRIVLAWIVIASFLIIFSKI